MISIWRNMHIDCKGKALILYREINTKEIMTKLLEQPIKIGNVEIHNRLVMPPMQSNNGTADGIMNDKALAYYEARLEGGKIGLLIPGHLFVSPEGRASTKQFSIASDDTIEGLKRLTDLAHKHGSKIFAQLAHAGSSSPDDAREDGVKAISASAVENPGVTGIKGNIPEAMTKDDILRVEDAFVKAALRAKEAGFDGIEIHSAHAYLLDQFWSPLTNKRTDEYGGSAENRLRFAVETLKAIREAVGSDYPVGIRFGACDYMDGGTNLEGVAEGTRILAATGIDFLDISAGMGGPLKGYTKDPGYLSDSSKIAKENCSVPVIVTGGIKTAEQAENVLESGAADMIGVGRALFAHADWARNAISD